MPDQDELFYRPDIKEPVRERDEVPEDIVKERVYKSKLAEEMGVLPEDIPDPLTAYERKFQEHKEIAEEIRTRATFLMDKTIEDMDLYVGDAPPHVLEMITALTDISFTNEDGSRKPTSDPVYTLPQDVAKCIFAVAGKYAPKASERDLLDSASEFDGETFKQSVQEKMTKSTYLQSLMYGFQLLLIVLKLVHVMVVHYSVGYLCGYFDGRLKVHLRVKIPKPVDKKITIWKKCIGCWIADEIIHPVEKKLLQIVGFKCQDETKPPVACDEEGWRNIDFEQVNCCTLQPIQLGGSGDSDTENFIQVSCFQQYVRTQVDPEYTAKRTICSYSIAEDASKTNEYTEDNLPTDYEKAAANEVSKYLVTRPSTTGTMDPQNIATLSKSIETADTGVVMTQSVLSSLNNNRSYILTGEKEDPWDCFGLADEDQRTPEERMMAAINTAAGNFLPKSGVPIEGQSYLQFLEIMDSVLTSLLQYTDKTVSLVANIARWGSSKQLCCFVYLLVAFSSVWHALIKHGALCPDMDEAEAIRNELRWAYNMRNNKDVQQFLALLRVIKQIVDIFINKMQRQIMITGFVLPLGELWELIKVTVSNGLSEFLDILFGPLDKVLAGMQTIPEVRHMMNNDCFGFGDFMKFLLCLLGNLKWGIINNVMKLLDFALPDVVLLQDIMLTRMRLKSLEALSNLLGSMIDLITGLKDCYDPSTLPQDIIQQEIQNEYSSAQNLVNLAGSPDNLKKFDDYSQPIMSDSALFTPDEQNAIDQRDGGLAKQFGDFGPAAKEIADNVIAGETLSVQRLVDEETGEMVDFGTFTTMMEEMTGTRVSEIQESMLHIFDILRGYSDETT